MNVLMQLGQQETSFFELTGSVHINTCSDEILSWLSMFWCSGLRSWCDRGDNASSWSSQWVHHSDSRGSTTGVCRQTGRQSDAACFGGKTASVEGVPGWKSSCVLAERQGSRHPTWTWSLARASSSAGAVSWIKERVGCVQTSIAQGVTGTGHNHREGSGWRDSSGASRHGWKQRSRRSSAPKVSGTCAKIRGHRRLKSSLRTGPEERAERHERFENRSPRYVQQESSAQSHITVQRMSLALVGLHQNWKNQRWRRARCFDGELRWRELLRMMHMYLQRRTDLSLACPLPEAPHSAGIDPELRLPMRVKRPGVDNQVDQSKRSCVNDLPDCSVVSFLRKKNEILEWTKKCNQRNSAPVEEMSSCCLFGLFCRTTIMRSCGELLDLGDSVIEEWNDENEDHQEVTTEQLIQGVARKGNERGVSVHEKSLIWAAKDTECRKLEERGAVRILVGDSAEKAGAQFSNRFIPSRLVVTRPSPDEFKARWCLRGYLDPDVTELVGSGSTQSPTVPQLGRMLCCEMIVSNGWNLQLGDIRGACLDADALDRKQGPLWSSLPPGGIPGVLDGSEILILGNIYGLNGAPQRWWEKFDAVMTSIGFIRGTFDVCVYAVRGTVGNLEGILCVFTWTTQFVVVLVPCFPKLWQSCDIVFLFGSGKLEKACFVVPSTSRTKIPKRSWSPRQSLQWKPTKVPMSPARKKMREDPADKAQIHASRGVSGSISSLAGQTRPDVSCPVFQLQQTLPQPTVAQLCASSMVVRRAQQHADLGLKIRRMPVPSMMLLLHIDASLNTGGLVGSQGGSICGVTD